MEIFEKNLILVEELLKESPYECTEKVYINLENGKRKGPYIRKIFDKNAGLGKAYCKIFDEAQKSGKNYASYKGLPKIYYVQNKDDKLIVFEEFIDGQPLDQYISRQIFSFDVIDKIMQDLCDATNELHTSFGSAIIHRDIKPSNIIISDNNQQTLLYLIDFGISRNFAEKKHDDTKKYGTIGYAPPEQFGFAQTDVRSDVFSIGRLLDFLLDQKNWKSKVNVLYAQKLDLYRKIVDKACAFDPKIRYKNVHDLKLACLKAANGGSIIDKIINNKVVNVLGAIWNAVLTIFAVTCIIIIVINLSVPGNPNHDNNSLVARMLFFIMFVFFIVFPAYYFLLYKPVIRKLIPKFPKISFSRQMLMLLICFCMVFVTGLFASMF